MEYINIVLGANIRKYRTMRRMTLADLAEVSGVSKSMLGQIERGEANPSVAILGKLASALKVPAEEFLRNDGFEALCLSREVDNRAERLDGGKVLLRPSIPYEEATRLETAFLDVYISGCYRPEPSVSGCVCTATVLSGTGLLTVEGETVPLQERDALRFAADQPWTLENQGNSTVRALLLWQYRKKES